MLSDPIPLLIAELNKRGIMITADVLSEVIDAAGLVLFDADHLRKQGKDFERRIRGDDQP